jgi:hypothetical protein|tara:strand:+ start:274 stop:627 length:354 start_codon:yes stop_codon:yes gene_type:complete
MTESKNNDKINGVPDNILKLSEDIIGTIPSMIETDYYSIEALRITLKKNKIIYSNKYFNGSNTIYNSGLIQFIDSDTLFYFIKNKHENTYKFYCLCKEESSDSVIFYISQLKKFKTI